MAGIIGCSSPIEDCYTVDNRSGDCYSVDRSAYSVTPNNPEGFTNPNDSTRPFTLKLNRTYWDQGKRADVLVSGKPEILQIGNTIELVVGEEPKLFYDTQEISGDQPWIIVDDIAGATTKSTDDDTLYVLYNIPRRLPRNLMR